MERHELPAMMSDLHLSEMRAAYDDVIADGVRRQHSAQHILGDLLRAELAEKQVRLIRYRLAAPKLPLAKEMADFDFSASSVNAPLARDLYRGGLLSPPRGLPGEPNLLPNPGEQNSRPVPSFKGVSFQRRLIGKKAQSEQK